MFDLLSTILQWLLSLTNNNATIAAENIALRHQLNILQRSIKHPSLNKWDRLLWVFLSKVWSEWRDALTMVKPATVIHWHRTLSKDTGAKNVLVKAGADLLSQRRQRG